MAETKVLIVGCGDLGTEVARQLTQLGIKTIGVRRSAQSIPDKETVQDLEIIPADVTQPVTLEVLGAIHPEIIVYCVAAGGQSDAEYKAAYVDGLRNVLATQKNNTRLKHVFFVSSTRVYGQETDSLLDESVPPIPADFGGERLLEAERLLQTLSCNGTALRLSGIYGPGRLRMLNLAKTPGHWPQQNSWSNRIHRDDAAAFITFLIQQALAGVAPQACYIVTDSRPVAQYEVLDWLASQLHVNQPKLIAVSGGRRLSNRFLLATGFKLQYPDYQAGYQSLLSQLTVQ
ncbi:MAG: SDR family oxidoreductase [Methylotenera sp.]